MLIEKTTKTTIMGYIGFTIMNLSSFMSYSHAGFSADVALVRTRTARWGSPASFPGPTGLHPSKRHSLRFRVQGLALTRV